MLRIAMVLALATLASVTYAEDSLHSTLDRAIQFQRTEGNIPAEARDASAVAFEQLSDEMRAKHARDNTRFPEPDRTEYYVAAVKMAIIDPPNHLGWPFRSSLRYHVHNELQRQVKANRDPFLLFCSIFPALDSREPGAAVHAVEKLIEVDEWLANVALRWSALHHDEPCWAAEFFETRGEHEKSLNMMKQIRKACFPGQTKSVGVDDFSSPPKAGAEFESDSALSLKFGLRAGTVVVALDGYRVENHDDYTMARILDLSNPQMEFVTWNGETYSAVSAQVEGRKFGVTVRDYEP